ncbi:MAG TPA: Hsp20/alpha crystallin family protein [Chloroflexi bacterium]|nr:Hsp20/alpha crystallin family protein [Chloroflexota bacterium]
MAITDLIPWKREEKAPIKREEQAAQSLQQEMNRLFDEFFTGFDLTPFRGFGGTWDAFRPSVDVVESDKEIKVSAELPGLDEKHIDVSLSRDALTIKGEKKEEREQKGENYYRMERSYGNFQRTIPLPCEVDTDDADAVFKNGVLTITLPKTAEAQACKKISVRAA